jgi:hypothetical protein
MNYLYNGRLRNRHRHVGRAYTASAFLGPPAGVSATARALGSNRLTD